MMNHDLISSAMSVTADRHVIVSLATPLNHIADAGA
jgi:hypothetical protein